LGYSAIKKTAQIKQSEKLPNLLTLIFFLQLVQRNCFRNYNIDPSDLLDDDLSDDTKCVKQIYDEHKRLSGNGFNAW
jgi:hypothetical protein